MTSPASGRSLRPPTTVAPNSPPTRDGSETGRSSRQRARILHELLRVRREAEAARLEAQASRLDASAEQLESLLKQIDAGETISAEQFQALGMDDVTATDPAQGSRRSSISAPARLESRVSQTVEKTGGASAKTVPAFTRFASWEAIRQAQSRGIYSHLESKLTRQEGPHHGIKPPRNRWRTSDEDGDEPPSVASPATPPLEPDGNASDGDSETRAPTTVDESLVLEEQTGAPLQRRRPTAVITSIIVHLVLMICLAVFTLSTVMPKDQIALAASASESTDEPIQTFEIEAAQPEPVTSEATEETAVELDPLGEMTMVEVNSSVLGTMSAPALNSGKFSQHATAASAAMMARPSGPASKMQFCGVEGGGNHFVYIVDSSLSMGDAFISARRALLDSIDMLTPEQRFYVIFYDTECDYMRITRADQDESRSVQATPANKQRLRSWAMRVEMNYGRAPYEPLEYALQKLKPDVIFLLSDGEFPKHMEELIQSENRVSNLFGETKPISIIHTISYHSREGEARMRRIAENNFGQYRHVPKP